MTDDIHDLFDSEGADESDGSREESDERSDESDESAEWTEFPSLGDEGSPADPERDESATPTTSSDGTAEDDSSEFEPAASTTSSDEVAAEDVVESESTESATTSSDATPEADTGGFESVETTTSIEASAEDDPGGPDPAVTVTASDEVTEEDVLDSEPTESTTSSLDGTIENDADGSDPTEPTPSHDRVAEDDRDRSAATLLPEDAPAEERDESESGEETASASKTIADDRDTSRSDEATISADGPILDERDDFETGGPDEFPSRASESTAGEGVTSYASGSSRLPTGIDELDRAMGGGVPPGRLVVLVADPGVQSELIVDSVLAQRDTLFVTTDRPDWEVTKDIEPGLGTGEVVIREHTPDTLLSGVDLLLDELGTSSNFVLDSVNELELVPRKRYRIFLSDVKRRLFETGSIGLLTGVTVDHESARDLTLRRADVVWRLETRTTDRVIENLLSVPKFRGGAAMTETVKLELTDEVRVDTSWNDG